MFRPVFIIGCPRSGTTITLQIMASHEKFAWISNLLDLFPSHLDISHLNRVYSLTSIGNSIYTLLTGRKSKYLRKYFPYPVEPYHFFGSYLDMFDQMREGPIPPLLPKPHHMSNDEAARINRVLKDVCKFQKKDMFVSKYTDFPRMQYLTKAFPEALFVHIVRDGRAVAASYLEQIEKGSFKTWHEREWWVQGWPKQWKDEWESKYKTPLSFVAFQWKYFVREIWKDKESIGCNQYLEVNYKDIVDSPGSTFRRIFDFCGLDMGNNVDDCLSRIKLPNYNSKWRSRFRDDEVYVLNEIIHEPDLLGLLD